MKTKLKNYMKGMNNKMKSCKKCCYITEIVNHTNPKQNYNIGTLGRAAYYQAMLKRIV